MKYTTCFTATAMLIFVASCGTKKMESSSDEIVAADETSVASTAVSQDLPKVDLYSNGKAKLIKTLNYRFEVDNVKKCTEAIEIVVKKYPAYISASKLTLENPLLESKLTIRVQSDFFQDIIKDIDQQAKFVNFRDVSTNDVSKDFVDLESRLKTKREVEARYAEILRKKTGTVEELFEAERQIGELHEEIEATISRINFLKEQVSYSTINLEFYQTITQEVIAGDQITKKERFTEALAAGWSGVVNVSLVFVYIWPLLFVGLIAVLLYRFIWKKKIGVQQL
jgi:hypothetical protein